MNVMTNKCKEKSFMMSSWKLVWKARSRIVFELESVEIWDESTVLSFKRFILFCFLFIYFRGKWRRTETKMRRRRRKSRETETKMKSESLVFRVVRLFGNLRQSEREWLSEHNYNLLLPPKNFAWYSLVYEYRYRDHMS